jgi:RNA polymerase sigma factor (sigma-70 family)
MRTRVRASASVSDPRPGSDGGVALDPAEFAALYDRHARALLRYCARRVGPGVAEDVVADTFLVAYERRHAFDPGRSEGLPWLYGIATNILRRHRRDEVRAYRAMARVGVDPLSNAAGVLEGHEQRVGERADASARSRAVAGVLADLPRRQRDVLLLVALADLEYGEVAAALGIPVGSVRSALHRARAKLRAALGAEGGH